MLTCRDCDFAGKFSDAVDHYRPTRHQLLYHGEPQDLTGFVGSCLACGADMAIYPSMANGLFPDRQICDACIFRKPL